MRVRHLLDDSKLDLMHIASYELPIMPDWLLYQPVVNLVMHTTATDAKLLKIRFHELTQQYSDFVHIYTDGSKENDKVSSAAIVRSTLLCCRMPNDASIFSAELMAINLL